MAKDNIREKISSREISRGVDNGSAAEAASLQMEAQTQAVQPGVCPICGAVNEHDALFCEQCGARLREFLCPHCNAPLDEEADYCENCHTYIDDEHCPFCYGLVGENDTFCPECGAPLAGIECPVCHTIGHFAFCASCGSALTDGARQELRDVWNNNPDTDKIRALETELERLWMVRPVTSERQRQEIQSVKLLCDRVKQLMAQEGANTYADDSEKPEEAPVAVLSEEELKKQILNKQQELQNLLDAMQMPVAENSCQARSYAMARKPRISRLAWKCNYKHALHSSPLGCACPHHGGKWVVLDGKTEVLDD